MGYLYYRNQKSLSEKETNIFKDRLLYLFNVVSLLYHETRSNLYYSVMEDLFETVSEGSGILNIGYSEDTDNVQLLEAQKNLVRISTANLSRPGIWLDVGSGIGGPACFLAKENSDIQITGININTFQLREAMRRAAKEGLSDQIRFKYGNAADIPFPNESFDGVYAIETAFHYPDKAAFACEAYRVLRSGHSFAVADIVVDFKKSSIFNPLYVRFGKMLMASPELYSPQKWRQTLKNAGFTEVKIQDITKQTFGLLTSWKDKIIENRSFLLQRYPILMLDLVQWSMDFFSKRLQAAPFGYFLMTAKKL